MRVADNPFSGIAMQCFPPLWKLTISQLLNRVPYTPKQVIVLFASPEKSIKRLSLCRPKAESALNTYS
jgi:hypothetical protein